MATYIQRGQAIGNALINGVATLQQLDRLGQALAQRDMRLQEYLAGDEATKAEVYVTAFRHFCLEVVKEYEGLQAVSEARVAAATAVDVDFAQAP